MQVLKMSNIDKSCELYLKYIVILKMNSVTFSKVTQYSVCAKVQNKFNKSGLILRICVYGCKHNM